MKFRHDVGRGDAGIENFRAARPAHAAVGDDVSDPNAYIRLHGGLVHPDGRTQFAGAYLHQHIGIVKFTVQDAIVFHNIRAELIGDLLGSHGTVAAQGDNDEDIAAAHAGPLNPGQQLLENGAHRSHPGVVVGDDTDLLSGLDQIFNPRSSHGMVQCVPDQSGRIGHLLGLVEPGILEAHAVRDPDRIACVPAAQGNESVMVHG